MPPAANLTPAQAAQLRSIGRVINAAERMLRDSTVDPAVLKDLGMSQPQFAAFVERYSERLRELKVQVSAAPSRTAGGTLAMPGSINLQQGRSAQQGLGASGTEKLTPDDLRKLYESRAAKVSPEYRKQVEAYYKAISEGSPAPTSAPAP